MIFLYRGDKMQNISLGDNIEKVNARYIPDNNMTLARYMDMAKFMDFIENQQICFTEISHFEDKYEDGIPENLLWNWSKESKEGYMRIENCFQKAVKKYVSCWNEFKYEDYALWNIYTDKKYGICIVTTVEKLKECIKDYNSEVYKVNYIKKNQNDNTEPPFYCDDKHNILLGRVYAALKYEMYSYEHEIRGIIFENVSPKNENNSLNYKMIKIDINNFIKEIYISPFAPEWYYNLITKIIKDRYSLKISINKSNICI